MFRTVPLSIIKNLALYTQQYIQVMLTACQQAVNITCMTCIYCCVYSARLLMMDRKPVRNMQSSIPKNKFENLVHLIGFRIRICHTEIWYNNNNYYYYYQFFIMRCRNYLSLIFFPASVLFTPSFLSLLWLYVVSVWNFLFCCLPGTFIKRLGFIIIIIIITFYRCK